jgi:hypothetical protein
VIRKILKGVLRAAVAQPWDYISEGAPHEREVRWSPDGRYLALWDPGNEPWFVIDTAAVKGRFVSSADMDEHAADWEQYLMVTDPDEE